jgi:hypothetical protein
LDHLAVLGRTSALDPDPTGPVVGHREEAVAVGCALQAVERSLVATVDALRVDDVDDVSCGPGELGRGQHPGLLVEQGLGTFTQTPVTRQGVDGVADHRRLGGRRLASVHRAQGGGLVSHQLERMAHDSASLAPVDAGAVRHPVSGRAPLQRLPRQVALVGLGDQPCLRCCQRRADLLHFLDARHHLVVREAGAQPLRE